MERGGRRAKSEARRTRNRERNWHTHRAVGFLFHLVSRRPSVPLSIVPLSLISSLLGSATECRATLRARKKPTANAPWAILFHSSRDALLSHCPTAPSSHYVLSYCPLSYCPLSHFPIAPSSIVPYLMPALLRHGVSGHITKRRAAPAPTTANSNNVEGSGAAV